MNIRIGLSQKPEPRHPPGTRQCPADDRANAPAAWDRAEEPRNARWRDTDELLSSYERRFGVPHLQRLPGRIVPKEAASLPRLRTRVRYRDSEEMLTNLVARQVDAVRH